MTDSTAHDSNGSGGGLKVHIVPPRILLAVWFGLIVMTVLTVAATSIDLGTGNLWLAMLIAAVKATAVALYFMHLRYDRLLHGFIFLGAILFVFLFIGIALMDTTAYQSDLIPDFAPGIDQ